MTSRIRTAWDFLLRPRTRYALAWLVAAIIAGLTGLRAWTGFDSTLHPDGTPRRRGGNNGHAMIDFGGQWLMGRMLVESQGRHLYHRNYYWEVLQAAYPESEEIPLAERTPEEGTQHEAESLVGWLVGENDPEAGHAVVSFAVLLAARQPLDAAVLGSAFGDRADALAELVTMPQLGGALYPPIHALVMAPIGLCRPATGYRMVQGFSLLLALIAGGAVCSLSQGRIWWPVGVSAVMLFPGFSHGLNLGQNNILMLTLLLWGWALAARGRPVAGGICWGLLAFKPVWPAAFFLAPVLARRWRFCGAMLATGLVCALATLPFVGLHAWIDWLRVGREASRLYSLDHNWVFLSRDLQNVARRWLFDFKTLPPPGMELAANLIGWALWLAVVECTVRLAVLRPHQARAWTGASATFLLLGSFFSCFHFMFYDELLTALPVFLLFTEPEIYLKLRFLGLFRPGGSFAHDAGAYYEPRLAATYPGNARDESRIVGVVNNPTLTLLALFALAALLVPSLAITVSVSVPGLHPHLPMPLRYTAGMPGTPWDTFCLLALWAWCGWLWLRTRPAENRPPSTPVGSSPIPDEVAATQLV
jgi:hypothetical protein